MQHRRWFWLSATLLAVAACNSHQRTATSSANRAAPRTSATSAVLDETLRRMPERGAQLAILALRFPAAVGEYQEALQ